MANALVFDVIGDDDVAIIAFDERQLAPKQRHLFSVYHFIKDVFALVFNFIIANVGAAYRLLAAVLFVCPPGVAVARNLPYPSREACGNCAFVQRKYENLKKGESTQKNIQKQKLKVQMLHHRIDNIRADYINKTIAEIVKTKPSYITIEDLNVAGMMKNRHLSKAVASQKFSEFRTKLKAKCDDNGIELRIVGRFYPSSKMCHCCGKNKKDF